MKYFLQMVIFVFFFSNLNLLIANEITAVNIVPENYFEEIEKEIKNAKKSIQIIVSSFSCSTDNTDNPIYKILQNLILAKVEGINIQFIFNSEYRYYFSLDEKNLNDSGWKLLKSSDIKINFFPENERNYSNLIIIDEQTVIEGSMPWIESIDTNKNFYTITKICSKEFAKSKLKMLNKKILIKNSDKDSNFFTNKMYKLYIPILSNNKWFNFYKNKSNELFDLYIILAIKALKKENRWFKISISNFRNILNKKKMAKLDFNKKMISYLNILKRWDLIYLKKDTSSNYTIKVVIPENVDKTFNIEIPENYFTFEYSKYLSLKEKIIYFLLLKQAYSQKSFPYFLINKEENIFDKISKEELNVILLLLEKHLLIEPYSFNIKENQNGYVFLAPKNIVLLNQINESLIHQYGKNEVEKASLIAQSFNKEKDTEVLKDILYFLKEIGFMEVQKIITPISELPIYHPERNFKTVKKNLVNSLNEKLKQEN